jgi:hypothetical protein
LLGDEEEKENPTYIWEELMRRYGISRIKMEDHLLRGGEKLLMWNQIPT